MQAEKPGTTDRGPHPEYLDIVGWRVVERLPSSGAWRRFLAVARERAALVEDDWLSARSSVPPGHRHPSPVDPVELVVEVASGRSDVSLSEVCELFEEMDAPSIPVLIDIGVTERHETTAVLEATTGSSIDELLDRPIPLSGGEIVTLLAPVVETLAELHTRGFAFGTLACSDVRLTASGRPVLLNWQAIARLPAGHEGPHPSVVRDWRCFETLADLVFAQLPTEAELPSSLQRELDRCLAGEVDAQLGGRILDALYSWQDASEVLDPALAETGPRLALLTEDWLDAPEETRGSAAGSQGVGGRVDRESPPSVATLLDEDEAGDGYPGADSAPSARFGVTRAHASEVRDARRRGRVQEPEETRSSRRAQRSRSRTSGLRRHLSAVRLPFRIAAMAAVVMCVCAAVIGMVGVEPEPGAEVALTAPGASSTAAAGVDDADTLGSAHQESEASAPSNQTAEPDSGLGASPLDWQSVAATEDPTLAGLALVQRRSECLVSSPPGCLEEIYQSDAPGLQADLARADSGTDHLAGLTSATLRDRYGDFVVLDLWPPDAVQSAETPTASLTIARGEAGWRLRDVRVAGASGE